MIRRTGLVVEIPARLYRAINRARSMFLDAWHHPPRFAGMITLLLRDDTEDANV